MRASFNVINVQEKESYYSSLEIVLREVGTMILSKEMAYLYFLTVMCLKEIGKIIQL